MLDTNIQLIKRKISQLENDIINLAWKSFTTITEFDQLYIDELSSTSNIDNSSIYQYDSTNKLVFKPSGSNLTLVTKNIDFYEINPTSSFSIIEIIYPTNGYNINSDIKLYISLGQLNYTQVTNFYHLWTQSSTRTSYLKGEINNLGLSGTSTVSLKIQTFNSKDIKISAYSVGVRF